MADAWVVGLKNRKEFMSHAIARVIGPEIAAVGAVVEVSVVELMDQLILILLETSVLIQQLQAAIL